MYFVSVLVNSKSQIGVVSMAVISCCNCSKDAVFPLSVLCKSAGFSDVRIVFKLIQDKDFAICNSQQFFD